MKLPIAIIGVSAAALAGSTAPPAASVAPKVVAELAGRTPGKSQRCVSVQPGLLFQTSGEDPHLLLYNDGKAIWASKLEPSCGFGPNESVIPDETAASYCHGDFVRQGNRIELSPFGAHCVLGNFTPYRNAR